MSKDIVERIDELRASLTDLQDRVEIDLAASAASRRYEDFVRSITDWVWETDANLNYLYASEGIASVFGVPAQAIEGRHLFALTHFRQINDTVFGLIDLMAAHRPFRDVPLKITDIAGETHEILLNGVPVFEEGSGRFIGYRGSGVDLSTRASLFGRGMTGRDAPPEPVDETPPAPGLWALDTETDGLSLAPDVIGTLGLAPEDAPTSLADWQALVAPEDAAALEAALADLISGQALSIEVEQRPLRTGGAPRWLLLRALAQRAPSGKTLRVLGSCTDISALKAREAALSSESKAAGLANRAKTEFLANLSHEIRTPLNAIIGFSEAIKEGYLGPLSVEKSREYASDVFNASSHLLELINDILDISKVEAGQIELSETDIDVADLIEQSTRLVEGRAAEGWLTLSVDTESGLPLLKADPRFVKQVLVNLLINAVKFTDRGGHVKTRALLNPDGGIGIVVTDSGIGMDPADIPKALQPFGQLRSRDAARPAEGAGLGLPLSKALMELHGGTLHVESATGRGTTVTIAFPATRTVVSAS